MFVILRKSIPLYDLSRVPERRWVELPPGTYEVQRGENPWGTYPGKWLIVKGYRIGADEWWWKHHQDEDTPVPNWEFFEGRRLVH